MSEIIVQDLLKCNNFTSQSTNDSYHSANLSSLLPANDGYNPLETERTLTDLEERILYFYYDEWLQIGRESDRSLDELSSRFNIHPNNISSIVSSLTRFGFLKRIHGGSRNKKTCITCEGFTYLENKPRSQIRSQIEVSPYIDLSKTKEQDLFLEETVSCEQLLEDPNEDIENKLDTFLMQQKVPYGLRDEIKNEIKRSRIGPVRTLGVITRAFKASLKKSIGCVYRYIRKCIENERRKLTDLFVLLRDKNLPFYEYARQ